MNLVLNSGPIFSDCNNHTTICFKNTLFLYTVPVKTSITVGFGAIHLYLFFVIIHFLHLTCFEKLKTDKV